MTNNSRTDLYSRITGKIVADLERGVRPWMKPWNADHAAGKITRPLRHNGIPYKGINVLMLWSAAVTKGYACPLWLTFRQALELGGHVRKGETGELVVYADRIRRRRAPRTGPPPEGGPHIPGGTAMTKPAFILIDGRRYLWRDILDRRRRQLAEVAKAAQPTLFELRDDSRPLGERTAAGRYAEPTLFERA